MWSGTQTQSESESNSHCGARFGESKVKFMGLSGRDSPPWLKGASRNQRKAFLLGSVELFHETENVSEVGCASVGASIDLNSEIAPLAEALWSNSVSIGEYWEQKWKRGKEGIGRTGECK